MDSDYNPFSARIEKVSVAQHIQFNTPEGEFFIKVEENVNNWMNNPNSQFRTQYRVSTSRSRIREGTHFYMSKMEAIKYVREMGNLSLKDAKDAIDAVTISPTKVRP